MTMLTTAEAAAILSVTVRQVVRLIDAGKLPALNVGTAGHRDFRINPADLERLAFVPAAPPPSQRPRPASLRTFVRLTRI